MAQSPVPGGQPGGGSRPPKPPKMPRSQPSSPGLGPMKFPGASDSNPTSPDKQKQPFATGSGADTDDDYSYHAETETTNADDEEEAEVPQLIDPPVFSLARDESNDVLRLDDNFMDSLLDAAPRKRSSASNRDKSPKKSGSPKRGRSPPGRSKQANKEAANTNTNTTRVLRKRPRQAVVTVRELEQQTKAKRRLHNIANEHAKRTSTRNTATSGHASNEGMGEKGNGQGSGHGIGIGSHSNIHDFFSQTKTTTAVQRTPSGHDADDSMVKVKVEADAEALGRVVSVEEMQGHEPTEDVKSDGMNVFLFDVDHSKEGATRMLQPAEILLYGCTDKGESVLVHVYGFRPYFYIQYNEAYLVSQLGVDVDVGDGDQQGERKERVWDQIAAKLKHSLLQRARSAVSSSSASAVKDGDVTVELLPRRSFVFYNTSNTATEWVVKIDCVSSTLKNKLAQYLQETAPYDNLEMYESNVELDLRFLTDTDLSGGSWLRLKAGKYHVMTGHATCVSTCRIEASMAWQDWFEAVTVMPMDHAWSKVPPLRLLSFSVQATKCNLDSSYYLEHDGDPIGMISCCTTSYPSNQIQNLILTWGEGVSAWDSGTTVQHCQNERDMLNRFQQLITEYDPDIITGMDIGYVQVPYLIQRANHHKLSNFGCFGRLRHERTKVKKLQTYTAKWAKSKARMASTTNQESSDILAVGRLVIDMMRVVQVDEAHRTYSVTEISLAHFKESIETIKHTDVQTLWNGTAPNRTRLAQISNKVSRLAIRLMLKKQTITEAVELGRVTGLALKNVFTRGQMARVWSLVLRQANQQGFVVPAKVHDDKLGGITEGPLILDPSHKAPDRPVEIALHKGVV
eukprot:GFYU01025191.1.p1 GENE.GFYU01025191.1~~GFYU01025191.1.p1  ORF type:complete len:977 (-),score=241.08 GFYU01025191.1:11-2566(-)